MHRAAGRDDSPRRLGASHKHQFATGYATIDVVVIGVLDNVSLAIGTPLDEVRGLQDETLRWDAVVDEARAFLKVVEGAKLMLHQQLALLAAQAYTIGTQLAKDPAKSVLVPHVEEVKRLKGVARRRKATQPPRPPAPLPLDRENAQSD